MRSFFRKSDANFYFTKHVLDECDNVINRKIHIINVILGDAILFLDDNHNNIFTRENFIKKFTKHYKNNPYKKFKIKDIEYTLTKIWDNKCDESMEGYNLSNVLNKYKLSIKKNMDIHKQKLYQKLILIDNHIKNHEKINKQLLLNKSHDEDNQIILDIYEYYLNHKITFIFITFDKNFYNALKRCKFKFIKNVYNKEDIKRFIN